ncbi:hypothetical protein HZS_6429 [Henneguya salminicola]|nr:hypothetical protein HZS_6429 [Henneguya salminicola]
MEYILTKDNYVATEIAMLYKIQSLSQMHILTLLVLFKSSNPSSNIIKNAVIRSVKTLKLFLNIKQKS